MPFDIKIKKLGAEDLSALKQLVEIFKTVFEDDAIRNGNDDYLIELLDKKEFIALVIFIDEKIIGGLTAYELPSMYGNFSEVYIYDIAIKKEYQRKGTGLMLINFLKQYCSLNNITTMFVEAEEQDAYAIEFYRKTKATEQSVFHFEYYLNNDENKI